MKIAVNMGILQDKTGYSHAKSEPMEAQRITRVNIAQYVSSAMLILYILMSTWIENYRKVYVEQTQI